MPSCPLNHRRGHRSIGAAAPIGAGLEHRPRLLHRRAVWLQHRLWIRHQQALRLQRCLNPAGLGTSPSKGPAAAPPHHGCLKPTQFSGEVDGQGERRSIPSNEEKERDRRWYCGVVVNARCRRKKCGKPFIGWNKVFEGVVVRGPDRNTWQSQDAARASMFTYGKILFG